MRALMCLLFLAVTQDFLRSEVIYNDHNYKYLNEPDGCIFKKNAIKTKLTILVKSSTTHFDRRSMIRKTYGAPNPDLKHFISQTIFELGLPINSSTQALIDTESRKFGDILQGDFLDSYRNITRKTIMGFKWAVEHCFNTDFFLVVDDDVLVSPRNLLSTLTSYKKSDLLYMGQIDKNHIPVRDKKDRRYISVDEFKDHKYPPVIFGGAVLYSHRAFQDICYKIPFTKYIWLEDVLIGFAAEAMNIKAVENPEFYIHKVNKVPTKIQVLHGLDNPEKFKKCFDLLETKHKILVKDCPKTYPVKKKVEKKHWSKPKKTKKKSSRKTPKKLG